MIRHHIEYLETKRDFLISESSIHRSFANFDKGPAIDRHSGFSRKKDCLNRIAELNAAAGYEICRYYGKINH